MTTPIWQQALMDSADESTRRFGRLFDTDAYSRTFDQINRSPTLQQDIIDFATATGRFTGYTLGNFTTADVAPRGGEYRSDTNTLAIGTLRLQGVDENGTINPLADSGPAIAHEIQHAFDRATNNSLPTRPDPGFPNSISPHIVWNNLLDEGEAQLRQYRIAKEIYDGEVMNYEVDASASRSVLRMDATRASNIAQWLADGNELYRQGLTPSADYLARANLAVDIGNNDRPSNSNASNYVDYYSNEGRQSATSAQRLQRLEITGIADGKVSVVFSSSGADDPVVHFTQPITAGAEGVWNVEICRPIPTGGTGNSPAPSIMVDGQPMTVTETVSSDAQGTWVTEFQGDVRTTYQYDSTNHLTATVTDSIATDDSGQQISQTQTTIDSEGSKTVTTSYSDGRVDTRIDGADGSVEIDWQRSDGSYGYDFTDAQGNHDAYDYGADGSCRSEYRNADGRYGSSRYDGLGNSQAESHGADGGAYRSWQKSDGSSHDDGTDALGNLSESDYTADGTGSSGYRNIDGSRGTSVSRPDGSSYTANWGADGSFDENAANADGGAYRSWQKSDGSSHWDSTDAHRNYSEWNYAGDGTYSNSFLRREYRHQHPQETHFSGG